MLFSRRSALIGLGATVCAPSILRAADAGGRRFTILRDGDDIGYQTNKVTRRGDVIVHECQARLKIKVLGITAYRYELDFVEEWQGGDLKMLMSKCYDDGDDDFVEVKRGGGRLEVEGSAYQGPCPLGVATTSYWSHDFLKRPVWISTQSGALLNMSATSAGAVDIAGAGGRISAERWALSGGYDANVFYKDRDWVGISFDAGGEEAIYVPDSANAQFMPVWEG